MSICTGENVNCSVRKSIVAAITIILAMLLLTACSGGPPDDVIQWSFDQWGEFSNVEILRKVKCDSVSTEAQAKGIDEAWLVSVDYDIDDSGEHVSNFVIPFVHKDDGWWEYWAEGGELAESMATFEYYTGGKLGPDAFFYLVRSTSSGPEARCP